MIGSCVVPVVVLYALLIRTAASGRGMFSSAYSEYTSSVPASLRITVRPVTMAMGLTQASRVRAPVRSREAASATVTQALTPLNDRAPPYFPEADQVAFDRVPVFPRPLASAAVVPDPSLNP